MSINKFPPKPKYDPDTGPVYLYGIHTVRAALGVFGVQLLLNASWSIVFFGLHSPLLYNVLGGLVIIVALWLAIVLAMVLFYKISRPAMYLLIPYILWVSFATYLNAALWVLNK